MANKIIKFLPGKYATIPRKNTKHEQPLPS